MGKKEKKEKKERKEREECVLRNGRLLLEKWIPYFDCKYSNPIRSFSAEELEKATDNYNQNLIYGFCSSYTWYKGYLEGGRVIFVKKYFDYFSTPFVDPGRVSNGISVAAQVSGHKNALKLLGCCLETQAPTLIFEFPKNGTLGDQLTSNPSSTCLPWKIRLKIAKEMASVITYLHTAFPRPIIHRDMHAPNFHLGQDFCAKLSDFMLCLALPEGHTQVENEPIMGSTSGYVAPEVFLSGVYSEKSDVFGFGSLLLHLLMGKRYHIESSVPIPAFDGLPSYIGNTEIVDPKIPAAAEAAGDRHQFRAVYQLALECCRKNADERPIMLDVAKQLSRIQRGDFISNEANHNDASSSSNIGRPNKE